MTRTRIALLLGSLTLTAASLAGCNSTPRSTTPPAEPTCNPFVLENGQSVCVHSEPLGPIVEGDLRRAGLTRASLVDPNFQGPLEQTVDLRSRGLDGCLQVRNQGECGWCTAHAVGAALDSLYCAEGCPPPRVSMPHLWESGHGGAIGAGDCTPGWGTEDGLRAASGSTPLVGESTWPYSGTPRSMDSGRPSDLTTGPRYGATGYGTVGVTHDAAQLESMKRTLASGRVLVVWSGVCFNNGWTGGTATIQAPTGNCAADGTSQYDGYHAYTIVGYDDTTMEFIALNSWGEGWGDAGYMRLSYGFAQQELLGVGYLDQINRDHGGCEMDPEMPRNTISERCAAVTGCESCAATSGCVYCDGACVAADAARTGPATGTCTTVAARTSACALPTGACSANTDCGTCAADSACAWCAARGACVAWPSEYAACEDGGRIAVDEAQCNDATRACEGAMDCGGCAAMAGCGWCEAPAGTIHAGGSGNCFGGSTTNPDRVSCDAMRWTGEGGMCPTADAGPGADGGAVDGGMPMTDGGEPTDPCEAAGSSCEPCNEAAGCGFCGATGTCMNDSRMGECGGDWRDGPAECIDCTARHSDCSSCMLDGFCGWCASSGTCLTADVSGLPPEPGCADWHFVDVAYCN